MKAQPLDRVLRKLERLHTPSDAEWYALRGAMGPERRFASHELLARQGVQPAAVFVVLDGLACRYKLLPDGRRQIVGFVLPGDVCCLRSLLLQRMDHSISALQCVAARPIGVHEFQELLARFPRLARALWGSMAVEDSIAREWMVNVGHRSAFERVAHLCCEMYWRLESVGLARDNQCQLPLTQLELGDTLALSSVHVNRMLMTLRRCGLLRLQRGRLELLNRKALEETAGFDTSYLYPRNVEPTELPANQAHLAHVRASGSWLGD